jgi:ribonuclease HII
MIGIDEVGRGAWAGPLLVCAARLNKKIAGLKDSKELSRSQREKLVDVISSNADIGYGWVGADEIDDIGLSEALKLATARAVIDIGFTPLEEVIIDGMVNFLPDIKAKTIIKADSLFPVVSAASIMAKVARDKYMIAIGEKYNNYDFCNNVGYGTNRHQLAVNKFGLSPIHRRSFNIKIISN